MSIKDIILDTFTNPGDNPRKNYSRNRMFLMGFVVIGYLLSITVMPVSGALLFLNHKGVEYNQCTGYISASSGADLDNFNQLTVGERTACTVFEFSALGMVPGLAILMVTSLYFLSGVPVASTRVLFFLLSGLLKSKER